ncbi:MAG: hypothetical protein AAF411_12560 [Myxococcota bacterium]
MSEEVSIGWIGPSEDRTALRAAATLLLDLGVDQAVYLGEAGFLEALVSEWTSELGGDGRPFLDRVVDVAERGTPDHIAALLQGQRSIRMLSRLRTLPPAPSRAVEMLSGRIVLAVQDKKVLDEEDIANASVIVFGKSKDWLFKRFGPRYFFSPGPLSKGRVGLIESDAEGRLELVGVDLSTGGESERHVLQGTSSRMTVAG